MALLSVCMNKRALTENFMKNIVLRNLSVICLCAGLSIPLSAQVVKNAPELGPDEFLIVDEDFSAVTSGTEDEPDRENPLAPYTADGVVGIDPSFTKQPGWKGQYVYPAGGCVALLGRIEYASPGILDIPVGDMSGDVTISFRAKRLNDSDAFIDVIFYVQVDGADYQLNTEDGTSTAHMFGEENGWQYYEIKNRCYVPDNRACIRFWAMHEVLIDDIRVTSDASEYIAPPTPKEPTDFTETGFRANWHSVRAAEQYRLGYGYLEEYGRVEPTYIDVPATQDYYVFDDLEPDGEYYYTLQAVRKNMTSEASDAVHAFGAPAPVALEATDVNNEDYSFTANWNAVTKGDNYLIQTYGVYTAREDVERHEIFADGFDKCVNPDAVDELDAMDLGNAEEIVLNDHTMFPGWSGIGNIVGNGYLGCKQVESVVANYVKTPTLDLSHADRFYVAVKAIGTPGDELQLRVNGRYYSALFDADGNIDEEIEIQESGKDLDVRFSSLNYMQFLLDEVRIKQDLSEGDEIYTLVDYRQTEAMDLSCTVDEIAYSGFNVFAYDVKAFHMYGSSMVGSEASNRIFVEFSKSVDDVCSDAGAYEVARYTIDGIKIDEPVKGINIVKYSNGKVLKEVVK